MDERRYSYRDILEMRGLDPEDKPCRDCGGLGVKAYGSTATWHGGIGGQAITNGVCDKCWGSGDSSNPWTNLRRMISRIKTLESKLREYE